MGLTYDVSILLVWAIATAAMGTASMAEVRIFADVWSDVAGEKRVKGQVRSVLKACYWNDGLVQASVWAMQ